MGRRLVRNQGLPALLEQRALSDGYFEAFAFAFEPDELAFEPDELDFAFEPVDFEDFVPFEAFEPELFEEPAFDDDEDEAEADEEVDFESDDDFFDRDPAARLPPPPSESPRTAASDSSSAAMRSGALVAFGASEVPASTTALPSALRSIIASSSSRYSSR